jgi:hypothetical protein
LKTNVDDVGQSGESGLKDADVYEIDLDFSIEISQPDREELARVLEVDSEKLPAALTKYAEAGLFEYTEMLLGRTKLKQVSDARESRVLALMVSGSDELPSEDLIGKLFQFSPREARALIEGTVDHFPHQLRELAERAYEKQFKLIPATGWKKKGDDSKFIQFTSRAAVEGLNRIIGRQDPSAALIRLKPGTGSTYVVKPSAYEALKRYFGEKKSRA